MLTSINKKGISSVVAMSLLITVAVISIISFQTWFKNYENVILADTETTSNEALQSLAIEDLSIDSLYVLNDIEDNLSIIKLQIDNTTCSLNSNLNLGMNTLNISDCITNLTNTKVEIVLITPKRILQKSKFVKNIIASTSSEGSSTYELTGNFVSVWNTSKSGASNSTQITLPLESAGTYNFNVSWGDGSSDIITAWDQAEKTHNYASAGEYEVSISGQIRGFRFANNGDKLKITEIKEWGVLNVGNSNGYFYGCENLDSSATDALNLTGTTTLRLMFRGATSFNGNISNWNVSNVTSMYSMFYNADSFNQNLNNWDTSSVTILTDMFYLADAFNGNISTWDVSSVTNMYEMFSDAGAFNQDLSSWNTSSATSMGYMFFYAVTFNQDLSGWDVDQVTSYTNFDTGASAWVLPKPNFS